MAPRAARAPRQLVHRGVVEADAILVDEALAGPREARRRIVAAWSPGASVHRVGAALLLRFPAPRRLDCARAPGLPLVRTAAAPTAPLASAPLTPDEIAAASPPPGSIVLVRGGAVSAVVPTDADRRDPATWLDLDTFPVLDAAPLGAPPPAAKLVAAPSTVAARALFGIGAAPAEHSAVASVLAAIRAGRAPEPSMEAEASAQGSPVVSFFASLFASIASLLFGSAARSAAPSAGASSTGRALVAAPARPAGPSLADRIAARLRTWAALALVRARLAHLIGRRQAEYLGRLLDMLDRGDLEGALRHAIPLGGEAAEGPAAPMLGVPAPRSDFSIPLGRRGPGAAMLATTDLYEDLRRRYRALFERLERGGRIDEAAFVLAELLGQEVEAVAFLERHGRLRLAAELAEARHMAPGLLVRQWFLAGDVARAVRLARRHGAFADALVRLEKHARAPELRVRWAETLADAGHFAAAVDVIWPVEEARHLGAAWLDRAIAQGGTVAARMLARKLALVPESFPEVRDAALVLLAEGGPGAAAERRAFAEALTTVVSAPARVLARPTVRALVRDGVVSGDRAVRQFVEHLTTVSGDGALRADLPAWPTVDRVPFAQVAPPRAFSFAASDVGTVPVLDAAHLPNGRTAVALGEAGVRILARDGRPLFHLDQPAHRLVISDHGDRAIALAPRGDAQRLARLDLAGRRSEPWCVSPPLDAFAPDFDGSQWVVASAGKLLVVDAPEPWFAALASFDVLAWRGAHGIARSPRGCTFVGQGAEAPLACHHYDLPTWTLRKRSPIRLDPEGPGGEGFAVSAPGAFAWTTLGRGGAAVVHTSPTGTVREAKLDLPERASPLALALRGDWLACAASHPDGVEVLLLDDAQLTLRARIALAGATHATIRFADDTLTVADDRGRVIVLSLAHGSLVHDLRV